MFPSVSLSRTTYYYHLQNFKTGLVHILDILLEQIVFCSTKKDSSEKFCTAHQTLVKCVKSLK